MIIYIYPGPTSFLSPSYTYRGAHKLYSLIITPTFHLLPFPFLILYFLSHNQTYSKVVVAYFLPCQRDLKSLVNTISHSKYKITNFFKSKKPNRPLKFNLFYMQVYYTIIYKYGKLVLKKAYILKQLILYQ